MTGTLFYLVGARGCGKESLLQYVRERRADDSNILIAHRYSTKVKKDNDKENFIAITPREFDQRLHSALFSMAWESEGNFYGIGLEVDDWLRRGFNVLVNGSRAYLPMARKRYPSLVPVLIKVRPEIQTLRLMLKHISSSTEIRRSIERESRIAEQFDAPDLLTINNNGPLHIAGNMLLDAMRPSLLRKIG